MARRYTSIKPLVRCFNPITVNHHGVSYVVPCGRCSACILDKSNSWSMRLSAEIDACPYPIFFTLTYNNKYVPKAVVEWSEFFNDYIVRPADDNIRFNGVEDVKREADFNFHVGVDIANSVPIQNYKSGYFCYCDKRDIQLWLKQLKTKVYETFGKRNSFRHYLISEYGPTTYRSHYHGILFCQDKEISEYLLRGAMYENWKMSDKSLFDKYVHYCDSGCAGYLTQYLTCYSDLPAILKDEHFKPFRLASKSPAIGFVSFDKEKVFEDVNSGTIEYCKQVQRIEQNAVLVYPSNYTARLFPKCFEFSILSPSRLRQIYGLLFDEVGAGFEYDEVCIRLRQSLRPVDFFCTKTCYRYCIEHDVCPDTYVSLLIKYYYLKDMRTLRTFYEWQEKCTSFVKIAFAYSNFAEYVKHYSLLSDYKKLTIDFFCNSLGFDAYELSLKGVKSLVHNDSETIMFQKEIEDILSNMEKMPKFNELNGTAPHIV